MDVSKLPRLSETARHASPPAPSQPDSSDPPPPPQHTPVSAYPGVAAQVWLSLIIGIILMLVGMNFAKYAFAKLTARPFHTNVTWTSGPKAGQEVEYFELSGFTAWTEMGMFLFGLAMVFEAALLAVIFSRLGGKRLLGYTALVLTVLATALNLFVCVKVFGAGIIPLMSALAVAFGGYMAAYEWQLLRSLGGGGVTPRP